MNFDINGIEYLCRKGRPEQLWHVVRRLAPVVSGFVGADEKQAVAAIADYVGKLEDVEANKILFGLLKYIDRKMDNGIGYAKIVNEDSMTFMYQDIDIKDMFLLWYKSFSVNLLPFFPALTSALDLKEIKKPKDQ